MEEYQLYDFFVDCRRSGNVSGLFIAPKSAVDEIMGKRIYFGEILGKHSEVDIVIKPEHIHVLSNDHDKILWLRDLTGLTVSGYNPLDYYDPERDKEDDE